MTEALMAGVFSGLNWSHQDLRGRDFKDATFKQMDFSGADFSGADLTNVLCRDCQFVGANLSNCQLVGADLRGCNLRDSRLFGANLYRAILEGAELSGIQADQGTQFFHLHCPEKGAFVAYKKCFDDRVVQLLIPAEARRTSATDSSCRCEYAKVLTIKSIDFSQEYRDAVSYADQTFIYTVGELAVAENFNPDRWADSTGGIHFFMTRAEAIAYL